MLSLSANHRSQIQTHGERTYPDECCGLLLGRFGTSPTSEEHKILIEVWPVTNDWEGAGEFGLNDGQTARRRFLISPEDYLSGERHARQHGLEVIGTYHSHPDHPARPSEFDRGNAWPVYSYIIVSIQTGQAVDLASWILDEERQFQSETLQQTVEA
ncbi:MAG: M67 family metallopeptidase [Gemmatimonadaceae bacterium]|nr:M67 family metallopeptidase [Gloeobacterales cyanobacterium ES-bin-141]